MSEDCIFCRIVDGDIPANVVYENDYVLAFLDANPQAPGHTLVVPKDHFATLGATPTKVSEMTFAAVHYLTPSVEETVDADATSVGINNGETAGQEIPHLHVHIIPRFEGDGGGAITAVAGKTPDLSEDEIAEIAAEIEAAANE